MGLAGVTGNVLILLFPSHNGGIGRFISKNIGVGIVNVCNFIQLRHGAFQPVHIGVDVVAEIEENVIPNSIRSEAGIQSQAKLLVAFEGDLVMDQIAEAGLIIGCYLRNASIALLPQQLYIGREILRKFLRVQRADHPVVAVVSLCQEVTALCVDFCHLINIHQRHIAFHAPKGQIHVDPIFLGQIQHLIKALHLCRIRSQSIPVDRAAISIVIQRFQPGGLQHDPETVDSHFLYPAFHNRPIRFLKDASLYIRSEEMGIQLHAGAVNIDAHQVSHRYMGIPIWHHQLRRRLCCSGRRYLRCSARTFCHVTGCQRQHEG